MGIDWHLAAAVGMPIVTLFLGALINHFRESRPKLISHLGFIASHQLPPQADGTPGTIVNTHSIVIRNAGRRAATNVRLGHNFLPDINVRPDISYDVRDLPAGGKEIVFPTLIPKKQITVNYLYFAPNTWDKINTHLESDDGPANVVAVILQRQVKPWLLKVIWALVVIGCITSGYILVSFIRWIGT